MGIAEISGVLQRLQVMKTQVVAVECQLQVLADKRQQHVEQIAAIDAEVAGIVAQLDGQPGNSTPAPAPAAITATPLSTEALRQIILRVLPPTTEPAINHNTLKQALVQAGVPLDNDGQRKRLGKVLKALITDNQVVPRQTTSGRCYHRNNTVPAVEATAFTPPPSLAGNGRR
jgi:hypothetical protein